MARLLLRRTLDLKTTSKVLYIVILRHSSKDSSDRSHVDSDTSSRLSPYLAAGVISPREVIHRARKGRKLDLTRDTGLGMWTQEVAWRDFYGHILACYPRVCMGRPFQEKFADVLWEVEPEKLQAWKDGMTGYPIVDAAMRQCNQQGWMHNRARMIAGMFLTKDLMIDWRLVSLNRYVSLSH